MSNDAKNRVVWSEIPVANLERAKKFYETVLEAPLVENNEGPNPMAMLPYSGGNAASGHIYPGKPAQNGEGPTIHLAAPGSLEASMERVKQAGGSVVSDVISIPAGLFFYAIDTEGNSIGVFKS